MKKSSLLLLLLWHATALLAQNNYGSTADMSQIPFDPTQVQGFTKVCVKTAETEIPMEGVSFELQFVTPPPPTFWMEPFTGPDGCAKAFALPTDCTVLPYKNINPANGVTNLDVLLLRGHVLGISSLPSPYKILAADMNGSGSLSTSDLVLLSKLNQGEIDTLPVPSWRFVAVEYIFQNPQNPFQTPFPTFDTVAPSRQFLGIKMGDLNGTADPNNVTPAGPSANKTSPPKDPTQLQGPPPDTEPPMVVCLNGLPVNLFQTGEITLWASDFLLSVSDNVTPENVIKIGIRKAGSGTGFPVDANGNPVTSVTFNCNELGQQPVELWAIDEAGNADYCEAFVLIEDNFSHCNQAVDTFKVCFNFACDGAPMVGLPINIYNCVNFVPAFQAYSDSITGPDGCATMVVQALCDTYVIAPEKDDNPQNGLSTYDLFLISKHITGIEPLHSPYKLIAADANKSGSITTFDLIELRKLITGIYTELPNNTSWRFIDGDFVFPNPLNPFSSTFPESISLVNGQMTEGNFVGIKIGDVDCSASIDSLGAPADFPDALLTMPDTLLLSGQEYDIPISMAEQGLWSVYQFALNWDAQKLEFQNMAYNNATGPSNWNTLLAQQGSLTTSWFQYDLPVAFGPDDPIATIRFKALQTVSLKDVFFLNKDQLYPEGYAGQSAEKKDLLLTFLHQFKPSKSDLNAERNQPILDPTQLQPPPLDVQAPVISCLNGLSVNLMPTGSINLWATDVLQSVTDNVTPTDQIVISIRKSGTGVGFPEDASGNPILRTQFDCDELGTNGIELWAKDLAGNSAYCETYLILQDNLGNCPGGGVGDWLIQMCAKAASNDGLEELEFEVTGTNPNEPFYANEVSGPIDACGYFDVPLGSDVIAKPIKDDYPLNGVTTFDLVLISRHYRGIELLSTPYKIIAADANRDGLVTVEDSIELTKLILGIYTELPNNTSWRFVDKSFEFPDASNPFATSFPESIMVQNIQAPVWADFEGIKIGDVNGTAINNISNHEIIERAEPTVPPTFGLPNPNPTSGGAWLPIHLSTAERLHVELTDLAGRICWTNDLQLEKGDHNLEIPASAMTANGVYIWQLRSDTLLKSGKLMRQ